MTKLISAFTVLSSLSFAVPALAGNTQAALADYTRSAHAIVQELLVLKASSSSCGMVGQVIAGRMDNSLRTEQTQIATVTRAAAQGPAGKPAIQQQIDAMNRGNAELRGGTGMIRESLSGGDANCQKARTAFDRMSSLSFALPAKMKRVMDSL